MYTRVTVEGKRTIILCHYVSENVFMDFKTYLNSSNTDRKWCIINISQHRPQMMYYQYTVPNSFYELKYDVTVYEQFFYDDLVATILPCTIYSHTIFPAYTVLRLSSCFWGGAWVEGKSGAMILDMKKCSAAQGGNSQNFLGKFIRFFITLRCFME
jgi:hypothetical protein